MTRSYCRRAWNEHRVADTSVRRVKIPSCLRPPQPANAIRRVCFVDEPSHRRHQQSSVSPEFSGPARNACNSWSIRFVARIRQKHKNICPAVVCLDRGGFGRTWRRHAQEWCRLSGRGESPESLCGPGESDPGGSSATQTSWSGNRNPAKCSWDDNR